MNDTLLLVIRSIAEDILTLAHLIIEDQGLKGSALDKEAAYRIDMTNNVIIELLFNDYIQYIESGRHPHADTVPPISDLRNWALRKGLPTDNSTLFAIAQTIRKNGMAPRPILSTLEKEIDEAFQNEWAGNLFDSIIETLAVLFTD